MEMKQKSSANDVETKVCDQESQELHSACFEEDALTAKLTRDEFFKPHCRAEIIEEEHEHSDSPLNDDLDEMDTEDNSETSSCSLDNENVAIEEALNETIPENQFVMDLNKVCK